MALTFDGFEGGQKRRFGYFSLVAASEALHATPVESAMKFCHERERVRRQNFGVSGRDFTDNLDSLGNFVE
jgi:hypothetical protein